MSLLPRFSIFKFARTRIIKRRSLAHRAPSRLYLVRNSLCDIKTAPSFPFFPSPSSSRPFKTRAVLAPDDTIGRRWVICCAASFAAIQLCGALCGPRFGHAKELRFGPCFWNSWCRSVDDGRTVLRSRLFAIVADDRCYQSKRRIEKFVKIIWLSVWKSWKLCVV